MYRGGVFHLQPRDTQVEKILSLGRNNPTIPSGLAGACLKAVFESSKTRGLFTAYFDEELYHYAANYYDTHDFGRNRRIYSVVGVAKVLEDVEISQRNYPKYQDMKRFLDHDFATIHDDAKIINKFRRFFTARVDIQLMPKTGKGDFPIFSVSDERARVFENANWLSHDDVVGHSMHSHVGQLEFTVKPTVVGKILLRLRGLWVPNPEDKTKLIPYWVDYTKLIVNGKVIFDKLTPTWHNKFYNYEMNVKAGEEVKIQVEWLPHSSDASEEVVAPTPKPAVAPTPKPAVEPTPKPAVAPTPKPAVEPTPKPAVEPTPKPAVEPTPKPAVASTPKPAVASTPKPAVASTPKPAVEPTPKPAVEPTPKPAVEPTPKPAVASTPKPAVAPTPKPAVAPTPKPAVAEEVDTRTFTGRVDIQLVPKMAGGDFKILSVSDDKATVWKPDWFQKGGIGYQIQSYAGNMDIIAKATVDGQISLNLMGLDVRDPKDYSKRIPYWVDYTKLIVNGKVIFDKLTPAWHDNFYRHNVDIKAGEEIKIKVEWLPHGRDI